MLRFTDEEGTTVEVAPDTFVIAGYTGRDRALVQKHIEELEREGIAPPPEVPMLYPMPIELLTTQPRITAPSAQSCGEVEPVLLGSGDLLYLGIGSDHTARDVEREDVMKSKRICPKPLGRSLARIKSLDASYDAIALESWIDGEAYQRGTLAQILPLSTLLDLLRSRYATRNFVLSCGTVPLLTDGFRFGRRFTARLHGGPLPTALTLEYEIEGDQRSCRNRSTNSSP
jgi:hypothetical protein